MGWNQREEEQEAVENLGKLLVAGLIICAVVAACSIVRMEQLQEKTPEQVKKEWIMDAAITQARWEARARAQQEVRQ